MPLCLRGVCAVRRRRGTGRPAAVTDDEELDIDKLIAFVEKQIKNDEEALMDPKDLPLIVKGEIDYEQSLEDFI